MYWRRLRASASVSITAVRHTIPSMLNCIYSENFRCPVWARGRCRISPPCFLAECCKRQLNQGSFVLLYFRLFTFSDLYWVCFYFPVLFCLSVPVKWLAVKTASEMTFIVSGGALNSTQTKLNFQFRQFAIENHIMSMLPISILSGFKYVSITGSYTRLGKLFQWSGHEGRLLNFINPGRTAKLV